MEENRISATNFEPKYYPSNETKVSLTVPSEILQLIGKFDQNIKSYQSGLYKEAQLREEFINPFFKILGWDMSNESGYSEAYKDVIHEDSIRIGGITKAPDYCFRIGGARKFFVEAKKPSVNLKDDANPAYQLRRYAWSAKLSLSILTDFEEFAVYDCRIKPLKNDSPAVARILYLKCQDYASHWAEIASIFSRESVLKGSFDKFAESTKTKKGTTEVDSVFLEEIESWRDALARNLALRNPKLTQYELNFAVQRTIDRIVFLRICEDRGIEKYGKLLSLKNEEKIYSHLFQLFERADERYNSGLFYFKKDKTRTEMPDELTPKLIMDDKPLKEIIGNLYYPESPYEFSVLPVDILGHVYEQFLGKIIRLTDGHRAVVENKPEVKKAGGVYYTPTYIVNYIVKNTISKLLEGKTVKQASKLKILDPACGSGSFLIEAYQYLLDWHRDKYITDGPEKNTKVLYQSSGGDWRINTSERKRILLNNIYGVDIDSQAVEVTKLSLSLKVLEGENEQTLEKQLLLFQERALPDLGSNIKCGNSLISTDFYENKQLNLFSDEDNQVNAFDWKAEFPLIMNSGGFDAIIGNPPWGAEFTNLELSYLRLRYKRVVARMIDSYIYFIDRAIELSKKDGVVGFIVPSTILNQVDAKPVRELLLARGLTTLISLGQGIFGVKVLNTSTIFVSSCCINDSSLSLKDLSAMPLEERKLALNNGSISLWQEWKNAVQNDPHYTFFVSDTRTIALFNQLRERYTTLEEILQGPIQRGVSPDIVDAHVLSKSDLEKLKIERELIQPSVSGSQIKRYRPWACDQGIIYTTKITKIEKFPNAEKQLTNFKHLNTCKEMADGKHPWFALHRPRDPEIFRSPKFIGLTTSKTIELIYDSDNSIFVTDAMYVFSLKSNQDPWACMAILQSKMFHFLYRVANQGESRVIPQIKASKLQTLPYPKYEPSKRTWEEISEKCKDMLLAHLKLTSATIPDEKIKLERQIFAIDQQINQLVYELYGLTKEEIKIVEGETKKET